MHERASAGRTLRGNLGFEVLEPPAHRSALEAEGGPVAERLAPLFLEPFGGFAHGLTVTPAVRVNDVAIAQRAEPVGSLSEVREAGLDREDLLQIYRNMVLTRGIEERGHILYRQGKIPGSFYTGRGNESAAVGVATAMGPEDVGTPLHRDMGVHVVRGVEPWRIFAQYMGRADGPTKGKDGNVHMADSKLGLIAMVSHLPAMLPVAVGCALAFRIREEKRVAVAWFGEGASARGDCHEGMTLAGVRKLPVVFVCDNNQWAYSTPTHLEYATEHVADRAQSYGFDGVVVDGTDVLAVYREAKRAIEKARAGGGPTLIESVTLRMEGHAVHDDAFYVPKQMFEEWAKSDPLERFRSWLRENANMTDDEEDEISAEVKKTLNDALKRAEESPLPDPSSLTDGVYASPEDLDTPHHK
jgi:TPP-dependent pyruvate/acetoin dehydrogenase alpha subunit